MSPNGAQVGGSHSLLLNSTAAVVEALRLVHSALERISLPAEHIIGMGTSACTLEAPDKRIRSYPSATDC